MATTRRRAVLKVSAPTSTVSSVQTNAPPIADASTIVATQVDWVMQGDLSAVKGFNVALTAAAGNPRNATDVIKMRVLDDPGIRRYVFTEMPAGSYVTWVQAYGENADGEWVSSTGVVIADDLVPSFRTGDDRNAFQMTEDFRSASIPTGITASAGDWSFSLTSTAGAWTSQKVANAGSQLYMFEWKSKAWADAYLDTYFNSSQLAQDSVRCVFKMIIDNPAWLPDGAVFELAANTGGAESGGVITIQFRPVNDGKWHMYYIPIGRFNFTSVNAAVTINLPATMAMSSIVRIDAIALAYGNIDQSIDGQVRRGVTAREQFGRGSGGGYFLQSPLVTPGDPAGYSLQVDSNGIFLRNDAGLVVEEGFRSGRQVSGVQMANGSTVNWGSNIYFDPALTSPVGYNKVRFVVEKLGAANIESAPAAYPLREYVELAEFFSTGCTLRYAMFEGGTPGIYSAAGPWSPQTSQSKSALVMNTDATKGSTHNDAAWYYVQDDGIPTTGVYYRRIAWIKVVTPDVRKPTGLPFYMDLTFTMHFGAASLDAVNNRMNISTGLLQAATISGYKARVMTDGLTWRFPIIAGGVQGTEGNYDKQNIKVHWTAKSTEASMPGTPTVSVEKCVWPYIDNPTTVILNATSTYRIIIVELF